MSTIDEKIQMKKKQIEKLTARISKAIGIVKKCTALSDKKTAQLGRLETKKLKKAAKTQLVKTQKVNPISEVK
jgi:hypothetical protein